MHLTGRQEEQVSVLPHGWVTQTQFLSAHNPHSGKDSQFSSFCGVRGGDRSLSWSHRCHLPSAQNALQARVAVGGRPALTPQSHTDNPKGTGHFQPVPMSPRMLRGAPDTGCAPLCAPSFTEPAPLCRQSRKATMMDSRDPKRGSFSRTLGATLGLGRVVRHHLSSSLPQL